jgi:hypothetical protein
VFASAFDSKRGKVVIFGGCCAAGVGLVGDTWEWDGRRWTQVAAAAAPSPRNGHAMVYDPRARAILLFGGRNEPDYFNDFWAFDGAWRQVPGPTR